MKRAVGKTKEANMFFVLVSLAFLFIFTLWSIGTFFIMLYVASNMRQEPKLERIKELEHKITSFKNEQ